MKFLKQLAISKTIILTLIGSAQAGTTATVYKSPTCGCCEEYIKNAMEYLKPVPVATLHS